MQCYYYVTMKIICRSWNDVSHGNGDERPSEVAYEDDPPGKSPRKCRKQRITTIIAFLINAIVIGTAYHSLGPIKRRTQCTPTTLPNITKAHLDSTQTCATFYPLNSAASDNLLGKLTFHTMQCLLHLQKDGRTPTKISNVTTAHLKSTQTCATFHLNSTASVNLPKKI